MTMNKVEKKTRNKQSIRERRRSLCNLSAGRQAGKTTLLSYVFNHAIDIETYKLRTKSTSVIVFSASVFQPKQPFNQPKPLINDVVRLVLDDEGTKRRDARTLL